MVVTLSMHLNFLVVISTTIYVYYYPCNKCPRICSPFMTYQRVCYQIITTGATNGVGTAYPSGASGFTPGFQWGPSYTVFSFMCMFCRSLFVISSFFFCPLCCLFFFDLRILITPLVSKNSTDNNSTNISITNNHLSPALTLHNDVGNSHPGCGKAHKYGGLRHCIFRMIYAIDLCINFLSSDLCISNLQL